MCLLRSGGRVDRESCRAVERVRFGDDELPRSEMGEEGGRELEGVEALVFCYGG